MSEPIPPETDLLVVGGGAAGFFAAIACAETAGPRARVLLLEKGSEVLQKVKISGGGRCNVTHACPAPSRLAKHYPRGEKMLVGPFSRFGPRETITWFAERGVELKTESDGRMFPTTDRSQTVIDCLTRTAISAGVTVCTGAPVTAVVPQPVGFDVTVGGEPVFAHNIILATGGTRSAVGAKIAANLGHTLVPAVPSLFTFRIGDPRLSGLQGLSVPEATAAVNGSKLTSSGAVLVTHWGLSGPGILRLSSWGARELHSLGYRFPLRINWVPGTDPAEQIRRCRAETPRRHVAGHCPFPQVPRRLWERLVAAAGISPAVQFSQLPKTGAAKLVAELSAGIYQVTGKSTNKDEFVTCGGVSLNEIDPKTMESRLCSGLYFAGELLDVDGITGGFNFQNAWTTAHLSGVAVAERLAS